ncbi:MAG TPA: hypothetical protein VGI46_16735 [Candidatus Acidoferrum sp.]|jgi:hypothetical protein
MTKEELETVLRTLDIWVIVFGILVAIGVTGEAIVGYFHFRKSGQLQRLQAAENLGQQGEIERLRNQTGQVMERAAKAEERAAEANKAAEEERLARLKIEERLAPRRLTAEQIHFLQTKLGRFAGQPIQISYLVGDVESQTYASEFAEALGPIGWQVGMGPPNMFNFAGLAIRVQDPTEVPEAAEEMAKVIEATGITVQRTHTPNKVQINGNRPSRSFDLWVSKKGGSIVVARGPMPLQIPRISEIASGAGVDGMSDEELVAAAVEFARAMREFEASNQAQLANEWRADNQPILPGSYRFVFEEFRVRAIQIRDELLRRSGADRATTFALDADTLAGPSPIADAANYLDELAKKLSTSRK